MIGLLEAKTGAASHLSLQKAQNGEEMVRAGPEGTK